MQLSNLILPQTNSRRPSHSSTNTTPGEDMSVSSSDMAFSPPEQSGLSLSRHAYEEGITEEDEDNMQTARPSPVLPLSPATERTSLLNAGQHSPSPPSSPKVSPSTSSLKEKVKEAVAPKHLVHVASVALRSIPAVLLGCLLNILDGVSCTFQSFPSSYNVHYTN